MKGVGDIGVSSAFLVVAGLILLWIFVSMSQLRFCHIYVPVLLFISLGLFIDSAWVAKLIPGNQWICNVLAVALFVWISTKVNRPVRKLMLYGLVVALGGEVFFSLILGMYTYRLGNVPVYVPFGHALVYASVYYFTRERIVRSHRRQIIAFLYPLMIVYSTLWLLVGHDLLGFACMLTALLLLWRWPESRLFFLSMFFMIVYLELVGTAYGCWYWPPIWFGRLHWVPSANPPSGISVFYFGFDAGSLWLYKHLNRRQWRRMRAMQRGKAQECLGSE